MYSINHFLLEKKLINKFTVSIIHIIHISQLAMNDCTYIISKDIGSIICSYLDNKSILKMSEVNKYYCDYLEQQRSDINTVKKDLVLACKTFDLSGAKEVYDMIEKNNVLGSVGNFFGNFIGLNKAKNNRLQKAFIATCSKGKIEVAQWLIEVAIKDYCNINIHAHRDLAFYNACKNGHIPMAKWLIKLSEDNNHSIYFHSANHEYLFQIVCQNGHLDMAKYLIELGENAYGKINVHANNELAYRLACRNNQTEVVDWLIELGKTTYGEINTLVFDNFTYEKILSENNITFSELVLQIFNQNQLDQMKSGMYINTPSNNYCLLMAVFAGDIQTVVNLIKLDKENGCKYDIHADNEVLFCCACALGHLDIAQFLIHEGEETYGKINIHTNHNTAFKFAYDNGFHHITDWLMELSQKGY